MKYKSIRFAGTCLVALLMLGSLPVRAAVWQYSVPMAGTQEQRAYLWVPQDAHRIRGLVVGLQNMLEKPMFEDETIRAACADAGLGIVWIAPGDEKPHPPLNILLDNPAAGAAALDQALADLAKQSGYSEVQYAPLLPVGHSAASPFVYGIGFQRPDRIFALMPNKGWFLAHIPEHIPTLHISSEWAEWGKDWGETWHKDGASVLKLRAEPGEREIGDFIDAGAGHFDYTPESSKVIGLFIKKAANARIPADAPLDGPVALKPYPEERGVLVDPATLGTAQFAAIPYARYKGDPKAAYWYVDAEMASAVNAFAAERFAKKPQAIDFVDEAGQPYPLTKNGFADAGAKLLPDGVTFKVAAAYLPQSASANLYGGQALGHAETPIKFRVGSGALAQTGPDTFKFAFGPGGIARQGNPWEPWIIAYSTGDAQYRPADRPMHVWISMFNKDGATQTIDWPQIADKKVGAKPFDLGATASSGLPVQYWVVSGPATVTADGKLRLEAIPPRSRFPVTIRVAAFQWGRQGDSKVQSVRPVYQEFGIVK